MHSVTLFIFSHHIYFQTPYLCSVSSYLYSVTCYEYSVSSYLYSVKSYFYSVSSYIYSASFSQKQPPEKETSKQVFSCKYCEIFRNIYPEEHERTAASVFCIVLYLTYRPGVHRFEETSKSLATKESYF